jgi:glycosyltransferase involved in cell wall biosynthesis
MVLMSEIIERAALPSIPDGNDLAMISKDCRPLDILIVTSEAPPIVSGISTYIGQLAKGLTRRGHNVNVLSSVQIGGIALGEWRFSAFAAHWRRVARALKQFDVVNVHGPAPTMSDIFLRQVNRLPSYARPAVVYTHHSPIYIRNASWMSARYNQHHKSLALCADRIVTSSDYYANEYRTRHGPLVHAIPWGVNIQPSWNQTIISPEPVGSQRLRALFVGQMRPYMGIETLLAAVADQEWLELTLVGHGPELARYQRLAKRLCVNNARFTGRLSEQELLNEYRSHDIVVLPSVTRAEAFGLVLLEGMANGCVPVASDLPGVRDVAGPTGLVVPPGDAEALRGALRRLSLDPQLLQEFKHASHKAAQALSWDHCVNSYEQVLTDAVRSRFARLYGVAMLPEVSGTAPTSLGTRWTVPATSVNSDVERAPAVAP